MEGNVNRAYHDIKSRCREAQLRELSRRYIWNIKPKVKRKIMADKQKEMAKREEFNRKLGIAIEMMER